MAGIDGNNAFGKAKVLDDDEEEEEEEDIDGDMADNEDHDEVLDIDDDSDDEGLTVKSLEEEEDEERLGGDCFGILFPISLSYMTDYSPPAVVNGITYFWDQ